MIKIPAIHIVYVTISIVIDTISRDLAGIDPDRIGKILMSDIDSRIDHGYDRIMASVSVFFPCMFKINVDPGFCPDLTHLHKNPEKIFLFLFTDRIASGFPLLPSAGPVILYRILIAVAGADR